MIDYPERGVSCSHHGGVNFEIVLTWSMYLGLPSDYRLRNELIRGAG